MTMLVHDRGGLSLSGLLHEGWDHLLSMLHTFFSRHDIDDASIDWEDGEGL